MTQKASITLDINSHTETSNHCYLDGECEGGIGFRQNGIFYTFGWIEEAGSSDQAMSEQLAVIESMFEDALKYGWQFKVTFEVIK